MPNGRPSASGGIPKNLVSEKPPPYATGTVIVSCRRLRFFGPRGRSGFSSDLGIRKAAPCSKKSAIVEGGKGKPAGACSTDRGDRARLGILSISVFLPTRTVSNGYTHTENGRKTALKIETVVCLVCSTWNKFILVFFVFFWFFIW